MPGFSLENPLKECLEACIIDATQSGNTVTFTKGDNTTSTITFSAGISAYSNTVDYSIGAVVTSADALFIATAANGPGSSIVDPSTDTVGAAWQKVLSGINGILSVSNGGTGVTNLSAALMAALPYSATVDYVAGAIVSANGNLYVCLAANGPSTAVAAVTDTSKWAKVILTLATPTAAGYMSAEDKRALDALVYGEIPDGIIGVEYKNNAWHHINKYGQAVTPGATFFDDHPIWRDIITVTIDDCVMVKIPKFYFLYEQITSGHRWWVSKNAFTIDDVGTAIVHPAFVINNVDIDQFYVGAYENSTDSSNSSKATSQNNKAPLTNISFTTMSTRCQNRNNGTTVTGFDMWNVYQLSAIQMLCLVEMGNGNSQSIFGYGNSSSGSKVQTGQTNAVWRGIHELWGNAWHMVKGLELRNGVYYLWTNAGDTTFVSTNINSPSIGWGLDISSVEAEKGIFLYTQTSANDYSTSMFKDLFSCDTSVTAAVFQQGGSVNSSYGSDAAGLFYHYFHRNATGSDINTGSRLSKI